MPAIVTGDLCFMLSRKTVPFSVVECFDTVIKDFPEDPEYLSIRQYYHL
ncbi:hypothetical protein [Aestuariirhabdus sp. LZHN29]